MKRNLLKPLVCLSLAAMTFAMPLSASAASLAHIVKINVSDARLREGPGDTGVVAKLSRGTKVLYWGEKKDSFCKVVTTGGKVGYIYEDFLSEYGTVKKSMLYTTEKTTPLYKKSGSSLKKNGSIKAGQLVLVYKTNDSWAYIKTTSGKSGYCKLSYLDDVF